MSREKRYRCNCPGIGVRNCYHPCNAGCCTGGTPAGGKSIARYGVNNTPTYAGRHQMCKFSCNHYDEIHRVCPCHQRPRICCGAEKPISNVGLVRGGSSNPADISSFGFTTNYDGRVRGGVKTREAFFRPTRGYAFDTVSSNF